MPTAFFIRFGQKSLLWKLYVILAGAWMQMIGTMLLVLFAFAIVHLSKAANRFSGWATFFGAMLLMVVSVIEVNFYLNSLTSTRETIEANIDLIKSTQHLFSMVGAPTLFLSLGTVILGTKTLPRPFGYAAIFIGAAFVILGVVALYGLFQYLVDYRQWGKEFGGCLQRSFSSFAKKPIHEMF